MNITPFKYVIDAHVFALKNFENIVRLCLVAAVINTTFTVFDFGTPPLDTLNGGQDMGISAWLSWDVAIALVVGFILGIMFAVPYIQYAHAKINTPDSPIRPHIYMSVTWNTYKTAYLYASLKVFAIAFGIGIILFLIGAFLSIPYWITAVVFLIAMAFILRLQCMPIAAALGQDAQIQTIWHYTQNYTVTFVVLMIYNILFSIIWGGVIILLGTAFFAVDMLWADIVGDFITTLLSYAMTLALTHSFLFLYMALHPKTKPHPHHRA